MSRAWLLGACVVAGLLAGLILDPYRRVQGVWRHEAFFGGRPTSSWARSLQEADASTQARTQRLLEEGGARAVPVLTELLQTKTGPGNPADARWRAAETLGRIGHAVHGAGPALIRALADPDPFVRTVAAGAIPEVGISAEEAVPALAALLGSGQSVAACRALASYGAEAAPAVPALEKLLKDPAGDVRWNAARALGEIGPSAESAVPALVAVLRDEDAAVREHAAEALGDIGPAAAAAVPALVERLADKNERVRRDAARSLGQIGPLAASAAPALRKLLTDVYPPARAAATTALTQVTAPAVSVTPGPR